MANQLVEVLNSTGISALIGVGGGVVGALIGRGQGRSTRLRQERREDTAAWRAERSVAFTALMSKLDRAIRAAVHADAPRRHPSWGPHRQPDFEERRKKAWSAFREYNSAVDTIVVLGADGVHGCAIEAGSVLESYLGQLYRELGEIVHEDLPIVTIQDVSDGQQLLMEYVKYSLGIH